MLSASSFHIWSLPFQTAYLTIIEHKNDLIVGIKSNYNKMKEELVKINSNANASSKNIQNYLSFWLKKKITNNTTI